MATPQPHILSSKPQTLSVLSAKSTLSDALSAYPGSEVSEMFGLTAPKNHALTLDGKDEEKGSVRLLNASFKAILDFAKTYQTQNVQCGNTAVLG